MSRVLLAITVFNGEAHVVPCLKSAARLMEQGDSTLDVLVLDDCSPAPGFSGRLKALCAELGFRYYRTPRNLGIPRNVNLALLTCVREGFDFVVVANSDVLFPVNLIPEMSRVSVDPEVGSVTAWSNNVSAYSLRCTDPDRNLSEQDVVDWVSSSLAGNFSGSTIDIPAGISFCIMVKRSVIEDVGLMDPVYGRGYCEETDWTLRSQALGYRIVLAPGVFVYHAGGGSNVEAGLLTEGQTTVMANEAIIDLRYPQFRMQVDGFLASGTLEKARAEAERVILRDAGRQYGYTIEASWLKRPLRGDDLPRVILAPDGLANHAVAHFLGFAARIPLDPEDLRGSITGYFGREPTYFDALDHGAIADVFLGVARVRDVLPSYPSRV